MELIKIKFEIDDEEITELVKKYIVNKIRTQYKDYIEQRIQEDIEEEINIKVDNVNLPLRIQKISEWIKDKDPWAYLG